MSKFVILFVCLAVFQAASALECYTCVNCQGEMKTWPKSTCGASGVQPPAGYDFACAVIEYKDKITHKNAVDRKCVNAEKKNGKLTFNCPTANGEPIKDQCPVCQKDLCNSASSIKFSFVAFSCVVLAVFAPKFL
ncbi:hypothetical protein JTB14_030080 [Gonioctena quinquepunctata]|nr:hypothetical protein JTB14_030080 [Gonioctena quinquepunctata]